MTSLIDLWNQLYVLYWIVSTDGNLKDGFRPARYLNGIPDGIRTCSCELPRSHAIFVYYFIQYCTIFSNHSLLDIPDTYLLISSVLLSTKVRKVRILCVCVSNNFRLLPGVEHVHNQSIERVLELTSLHYVAIKWKHQNMWSHCKYIIHSTLN